MDNKKTEITLKPVRGPEEKITKLDITEGMVLVATDTGKMFMDANGKRVSIGGSGSPFIYAEATDLKPDENGLYKIEFGSLEDKNLLPQVNALVINQDGSFYRVIEVNRKEKFMKCIRISVSGGGGGGGGNTLAKSASIKGTALPTTTLVNGQDIIVTLTANAATDSTGEELDEEMTITWQIAKEGENKPYEQGNFKVKSKEPKDFNFGQYLRHNTASKISFKASGVNSGDTKIISYSVITVDMQLLPHPSFNSNTIYQSASVTMYCNVTGNIPKIVDFFIDGELVGTKKLGKNIIGTQSFDAKDIPHGYHTAKIELSQDVDGERGVKTTPLVFEIAVNDGVSAEPIIWLGDYKNRYYAYDAIKIPFSVYNPRKGTTTIRFFKGIAELDNSPREIANNAFGSFQITNPEIDTTSVYYIRAEGFSEVYRELQIEVVKDPNRDMTLVYPEDLVVDFDAAGRSNDESATKREMWAYTNHKSPSPTTLTGTFKGFNWYNNGWKLDENKDTCLRISNGAEFSIPLGITDINTSTAGKSSVTFEFQFKVRNVQEYGNLIKEITRYKEDNDYFNLYTQQKSQPNAINNYDQFLKQHLQSIGKDYDEFTDNKNFAFVYREINLNATFCQYYNKNNRIGLCLGPQDGFFTTGQNTVSVKYVEDQMTNLSIVFSYKDRKIYIYVNGIITGVTNITSDGKVSIDTPAIVFNSEYCDLDLYKFRVYKKDLSVADIDINFAVDHKDVLTYDHTRQLVQYNNNIGEYQFNYQSMLAFNEEHPDDYLMPYLIIETAGTDKLPYAKADKKVVSMEFVNVPLDRAYARGELEDLARQEGYTTTEDGRSAVENYYHDHCPSWKGSNINFAVQGTSSEFYPRRNYKAKTKDSTKNVNMYMHKGPFAAAYAAEGPARADKEHKLPVTTQLEYFHMNNKTVGTQKFTLKIDYMESSGTYNMGFANLIKTAYTKHPLNDYNKAGVFAKQNDTYELATGAYDPKAKYFEDSKGKKKVKIDNVTKIYEPNKYYVQKSTFEDYQFKNLQDYRTSVQGFPVLAFWKDPQGNYTFIGRYNMLLDKGADECYGFKVNKSIVNKFLKNKKVSDLVECWEFSNNSRSYCSFRDPGKRDVLDFVWKDSQNRIIKNSKGVCPIVTDSFEYRYHKDKDLLDYVYDDTSVPPVEVEELKKEYNENYGDITTEDNKVAIIKDKYSNWEKAVAWVWSTCTDYVPSMGTYTLKEIFEAVYEANKYYVYENSKYTLATGAFDAKTTYYKAVGSTKVSVKLTTDEAKVYKPNKYYIKQGGIYVLATEDEFDSSANYYELVVNQEELNKAKVLDKPVEYNGIRHERDTKEYRLAKFKAEFTKHFDFEYSLVYFIMTEAFLCYDSRGKNCMFASWGPLEKNGEYIWYPIFYDIDTQLGINNTGIPSYDYSVDATIEGCFSTSDSVLWTNLYTCFFNSIKAQYHTLKNNIANMNTGSSNAGPLYSVDHIEKWYLADPKECNEIVMRGARPLVALNMDEFYKYISITNGRVQYQDRQGGMTTDNGTFFYALQGDRSLSRQQFLARRINFLDSWLSEGDYSRSNGTNIRGRIAANNPKKNSDKWIEGRESNGVEEIIMDTPYYVIGPGGEIEKDQRGYPKKTNYLDADTYVDMTPYQKSYVTLGDDNESFASKPYTGVAVKFDFPPTLANGIRNSGNYPEQLLYLYGAASLKDIGDVSKLYWTEFYAENSPHLSRILLGNDDPQFYNKALKLPSFDADLKNKGKPLLKEVNLTNVTIDAGEGNSVNFNFESSEKMTIFKATGSNIEDIKFANGVALHTLYLPATMKGIKLLEANNLTKVLFSAKPSSVYDPKTDVWTAPQGLFIEGLTDLNEGQIDSADTNISFITLGGGKLGYDSFNLLKKLYRIKKNRNSVLKIAISNVDWSPYKKLDDGYAYDASEKNQYFMDDGHYGLVPYTSYQADEWKLKTINGEIYKLDTSVSEEQKKAVTLDFFRDLIERDIFKSDEDFNNLIPKISGTVFIGDEDEIEEGYIRNTLVEAFPNIDFRFKKVKKAYSAKFIQMEDDGTYKVIGTQKISVDKLTQKPWFDSPYAYRPDKANYDFHGWSRTRGKEGVIRAEDWHREQMEPGRFDYTFYAIFTKHKFTINFMAGTKDSDFKLIETKMIEYDEKLVTPSVLPSIDESKLDDEMRYKFLGYTQNKHSVIAKNAASADIKNIEVMRAVQDYTFYAVFTQESVYASPTPEKYFTFLQNASYSDAVDSPTYSIDEGYEVKVADGVTLSGKITIPTWYKGKPVIGLYRNALVNQTEVTHVYFYKEKDKDIKLRRLGVSCFDSCTNLKIVDLPDSLRVIRANAFTRCRSLQLYSVGKNIISLEQDAFNQAIANPPGSNSFDFRVGSSIVTMQNKVFSNNAGLLNSLTIGAPNSPTNLQNVGTLVTRQNAGREVQRITIYCSADRLDFFNSLKRGTSAAEDVNFHIAVGGQYNVVTT